MRHRDDSAALFTTSVAAENKKDAETLAHFYVENKQQITPTMGRGKAADERLPMRRLLRR